jgi:hypothetical protein
MDEDEYQALNSKNEREEYIKKIQLEKETAALREKARRREENKKAYERKKKIIGLVEALLFTAVIALHITLSFVQRTYTGVYFATLNFFNAMTDSNTPLNYLSDVLSYKSYQFSRERQSTTPSGTRSPGRTWAKRVF